MAEEVGAQHYWHINRLAAFAELVRADAIADEREACAKVPDGFIGGDVKI